VTVLLDEKVAAIWFAPTSRTSDFMACLRRAEESGSFTLTYRFRYYHPGSRHPFDGKDERSWYEYGISEQPEQHVIETIRAIVEGMVAASIATGMQESAPKVYELVRGDLPLRKFIDLFTALPFVHSQKETLQ
jgi:hypothetical protein